MKKVGRLTIIFLITLGIIPGCFEGEFLECSYPGVAKYFDVQDINLSHGIIEGDSYRLIDGSEPVNKESYDGVYLTPDVEFFSQLEKKDKGQFNFFFTNSLMACTPVDNGYLGSTSEKTLGIVVRTERDFNDDHPAGSDISDLMRIRTFDGLITIDEYIKQKEGDFLQQTDFPIIFRPTETPSLDASFEPSITFVIRENEQHSKTITPIEFIQ